MHMSLKLAAILVFNSLLFRISCVGGRQHGRHDMAGGRQHHTRGNRPSKVPSSGYNANSPQSASVTYDYEEGNGASSGWAGREFASAAQSTDTSRNGRGSEASCVKRCGDLLNRTAECQCNYRCAYYQDCCPDFLKLCSDIRIQEVGRNHGPIVVTMGSSGLDVGYLCFSQDWTVIEAAATCAVLGYDGKSNITDYNADDDKLSIKTNLPIIDSYATCTTGGTPLSNCTFATNVTKTSYCNLLAGVVCENANDTCNGQCGQTGNSSCDCSDTCASHLERSKGCCIDYKEHCPHLTTSSKAPERALGNISLTLGDFQSTAVIPVTLSGLPGFVGPVIGTVGAFLLVILLVSIAYKRRTKANHGRQPNNGMKTLELNPAGAGESGQSIDYADIGLAITNSSPECEVTVRSTGDAHDDTTHEYDYVDARIPDDACASTTNSPQVREQQLAQPNANDDECQLVDNVLYVPY